MNVPFTAAQGSIRSRSAATTPMPISTRPERSARNHRETRRHVALTIKNWLHCDSVIGLIRPRCPILSTGDDHFSERP
jgi:hypothetical protein